jgi:hypothetical protein
MDANRHHVSGFYSQREEAESVLSSLAARGLPRAQVQSFANDSTAPVPTAPGKNNEMLKDVLVDGAIGTAVGTGIGALAEVALVAANVTLFIASPLIAPLAMLGWGASLGAVIGAVAGTGKDSGNNPAKKEGKFAALIGDAISSGQVVLVAETRTEQETAMAREVIQASVGQYRELSTA